MQPTPYDPDIKEKRIDKNIKLILIDISKKEGD